MKPDEEESGDDSYSSLDAAAAKPVASPTGRYSGNGTTTRGTPPLGWALAIASCWVIVCSAAFSSATLVVGNAFNVHDGWWLVFTGLCAAPGFLVLLVSIVDYQTALIPKVPLPVGVGAGLIFIFTLPVAGIVLVIATWAAASELWYMMHGYT